MILTAQQAGLQYDQVSLQHPQPLKSFDNL